MVQLCLLIFTHERKEPIDVFCHGNLDSIVSLRHPKVHTLAEVGFIDPYHILYVLYKVLFREDCNAVNVTSINPVLLVWPPK